VTSANDGSDGLHIGATAGPHDYAADPASMKPLL
jgi:hypothetical protein